MDDINVKMQFELSVELADKKAKSVFSKYVAAASHHDFSLTFTLENAPPTQWGKASTSCGKSDLVEGFPHTALCANENAGVFLFDGVFKISDNYDETTVAYFSNKKNIVDVTGLDITILNKKGDEIQSDYQFEMVSPVTWSILGSKINKKTEKAKTASSKKRNLKGVFNIDLAILNLIHGDEMMAEDEDAVIALIKNNKKLKELIKTGKSSITRIWDIDSDLVSNIIIENVVVAGISTGSGKAPPSLKNVEITFSCDAFTDCDDEVKDEIAVGIMPVMMTDNTKLIFSYYEDYSIEFE